MFNVISITRGWLGVQFPEKKHYVTLEWPATYMSAFHPYVGICWFCKRFLLFQNSFRPSGRIIYKSSPKEFCSRWSSGLFTSNFHLASWHDVNGSHCTYSWKNLHNNYVERETLSEWHIVSVERRYGDSQTWPTVYLCTSIYDFSVITYMWHMHVTLLWIYLLYFSCRRQFWR